MDNKLSTIRKIEIYKIIILMVFVITSLFSAGCFAAAPSNFSQTTGDDGGSSTSSTTPTKITLSYSNITMYVGDSRYVSAIITPSTAKASVMWLSTNPNVASASGGTIRANTPGTAMITAKISDSLKATCNVTVLAKPKCNASTVLDGHNQYLKESYTNKKANTHDLVTTCSNCNSSWTTTNIAHKYTNSVCECGYKQQATSISLSQSSATITLGQTLSITANVNPAGSEGTIQWLSTNPDVVYARKNGDRGAVLEAKSIGTAMVTAKISDSMKATCNVTVVAKPKCSASSILSGHNQYLSSSYTNKKTSTHDMITTCTNCNSSWTTANIAHKYINNACECGYKQQATSISLNQTSATITVGQTLSITANVNPSGSAGTIQWLSTNPDIVYARKNGDRGAVLEAKSIGTAMVTAKISDSIKATCNVTVVAKPTCSASSILSGHNQYLSYSYTNKKASTHDMITTCTNCNSSWTTANIAHKYINNACECGYKQQATSVSLNQSSATITLGQTLSITANVNPAGSEGTIQWLSTNPDVVYARKNGDRGAVLEAKSIGTAMITAKISDSIKATCNVTVVAKPTCSASSILSGHNQYLKYTYTNKKASTHDIVTTCSSCGSSWTMANVAHKYTNNVCVCGKNPPATGISLNKTSATLTVGETTKLVATLLPSGSEGTIQWSSNNTKIATVSGGTVKAVAAGTATINAKVSDVVKATCIVTVVDVPKCSKSNILAGHDQYLKREYLNENEKTHDIRVTCTKCDKDWIIQAEIHTFVGVKCSICGYRKLPTGITLNKTNATLTVGETTKLVATLLPSGTEGTIQWSSNNTKIATVSGGTVKAVAVGTATITAKVSNTIKATCTVKVVEEPKCSEAKILEGHAQYLTYEYLNKNENTHDVKVTCSKCIESWQIKGESHIFVGAKCSKCGYKILATNIRLDKSSATLTIGQTLTLIATLSPAGADGSIQWSSSNSKIVTVNNGTVKAVSAGSATITAKVSNTIKATCTVKVVEEPKCSEVKILAGHEQYLTYEYSNKKENTHDVKVTCSKCIESWQIKGERHAFEKGVCRKCGQPQQVKSLIINTTSENIREGEKLQLSVKIEPSTVSEVIVWSSSNAKIATVNQNGLVTGIKAGTVVITAKASNGIKATCTVVVSEKEKCSLGNILIGHDTKINITYSDTKGDTHNEHYTCTECGTSWSKEKIEHTYIKEVCICGKTEVHDFNYTQKDEIYHIVTCSNCDYNKEVKHTEGKEKCECGFSKEIVCNHSSYEWVTVEEAVCNKPGLKVEKCVACGDVRNTKVIKIEHKYKVAQIKGDAEYHVGICQICGEEGARGKHIFGVSDKCLFCEYERAPLRCQDGKILLYHGAKVVRYEKLDDEKHISVYECKKCKDEFKVEGKHSLKAKEVKEFNDENHTLLMECKTCKDTFEVENKHIYIFGKCAVCGDKESKEDVCTEEETLVGHELTILSAKETSDGKNHIATYECKECDITYEKTEAHEFGKEDKCVCGFTANVANIYSNGSGGANVKNNGGIATDTDVPMSRTAAEKAIKENDTVDFTAFSSGLHNLETFVDAYNNVSTERGEAKPATIRLIEPAYMKIGGNKSDSSGTFKVFTENKLIKENVKIELVIGEKGGQGREATYQETIDLYMNLKAAGYNVELYAVNQDMVKYEGKDIECINIEYTPKRNSQHETAQDAAIYYWKLDKNSKNY